MSNYHYDLFIYTDDMTFGGSLWVSQRIKVTSVDEAKLRAKEIVTEGFSTPVDFGRVTRFVSPRKISHVDIHYVGATR